jgi:2-keto-4-pentenoate hydratase
MATHGNETEDEKIMAVAAALRRARESRVACSPVRNLLPEGSLEAAYAVQEANTRAALENGRRLVGRKIGLTARSVQDAFGVDQPDFGMLFVDMEIPSGESTPRAGLLQPRVEAELALVLQRDLTSQRPSITEVIRAVDFVLPAIEIVDSRIENWDIGIVDTIADNASSGLYVLGGRPVLLDAIDVELCGMAMEKNGLEAGFGAGLACLGSPLNAVRWLAGTLATVGRALQAGDIVLSGALAAPVPIESGDYVEARISRVGSVSVAFS